MKRSLSTVAAALLVLHSLNGCGDERAAADYLASAEQYSAQGKDGAAIIELKNALLLEPDNAAARLRLGEAYLRQFQLAAAEKELRQAMALEDSAQVRLLLTRTLYHQRKMLEIVEDIPDDGPAAEQNEPELLFLRIYAMQQLNKPGVDEAVIRLQQEAPQSPYAGLARVLVLSQERRIEEARALASEVLAGSPELVYALELDGSLAALLQDNEAAIRDYRKLVSQAPGSYYYKLILAGLLITNKAYLDAQPIVDELLQQFPDQAQANYYKAVIAYADNEFTVAAEHADRALASFPNHSPARLLSASAHYQLGQFEQASSVLEPISKRLPDNHPAKRLWAAIQLQLGDDEQAFKTLEGISEFSQEDANLVATVGQKLAQSGHYDDAVQLLSKALPQDESGKIQSQLGMTLLDAGKHTQGLRELEKLADEQPETVRAQLVLIMGYIKAGEKTKAEAQMNKLLEQVGETPTTLTLQSFLLLSSGDLAGAKRNYEKALRLDPENLDIHLNLANVLMSEKNPKQAREHYKLVLAKAPAKIGALEGMIRTATDRPMWQENRDYLEAVIAKEDPDPQVRYLLAETLYQLQDWAALKALYPEVMTQPLSTLYSVKEYLLLAQAHQMLGQANLALSVVRRWSDVQPDSAQAHYYLGKMYIQLRDVTAAEQQFAEAVRLQPESALAKLALVNTRLSTGKLGSVEQLIASLEKQIPTQPGFLLAKGRWQLASNDRAGAQQTFEQAHHLYPTAGTTLMLAHALWNNNEQERAIQLLNDWLATHPEDSKAMLVLANYQLKQRDYVAASGWYKKLVEKHPNSLVATNNLAWLLAEQGETEQALSLIQSAVEQWPDEAKVLDTYGVILLKNGAYQEALEVLQQASAKMSNNPSVQFHYAQALMSVNRDLEARAVLKKILMADQMFPERDQAEQLLKGA